MIALISSVPEESRLLARQLRKKSIVAGKLLSEGMIQDKKIIHIVSGIGKTNAAHAATILLERFSPGTVVLFGIGGAYPSSGLRVGDIAVAEKEAYGDEGVLVEQGFQGTDFIGIPLVKRGRRKYFNEFPLDARLIKVVMRSLGPMTCHSSLITGTKAGTFVTVSTCTGTKRRARELERRFGAICENMEGASVAHVCAVYGTPMIEIRSISNVVEDRDRGQWNIGLAAENCQEVVMGLLEKL